MLTLEEIKKPSGLQFNWPEATPGRFPVSAGKPAPTVGSLDTHQRAISFCATYSLNCASAWVKPHDCVSSSTVAPMPTSFAAWAKTGWRDHAVQSAPACPATARGSRAVHAPHPRPAPHFAGSDRRAWPTRPRAGHARHRVRPVAPPTRVAGAHSAAKRQTSRPHNRARTITAASRNNQMLSSSDHSSSLIILSSSTRISSSPFLLQTPWMNLADSSLPTFGAVSTSDWRR